MRLLIHSSSTNYCRPLWAATRGKPPSIDVHLSHSDRRILPSSAAIISPRSVTTEPVACRRCWQTETSSEVEFFGCFFSVSSDPRRMIRFDGQGSARCSWAPTTTGAFFVGRNLQTAHVIPCEVSALSSSACFHFQMRVSPPFRLATPEMEPECEWRSKKKRESAESRVPYFFRCIISFFLIGTRRKRENYEKFIDEQYDPLTTTSHNIDQWK